MKKILNNAYSLNCDENVGKIESSIKITDLEW